MSEFTELAELEFKLPPAPEVQDWDKRRIFGVARPIAPVGGTLPAGNRAFVMSLKDDGGSYFVDLLPAHWVLQLELPHHRKIEFDARLEAGEKKAIELSISSDLEEFAWLEVQEVHALGVLGERVRRRAGRIAQRNVRLDNILDNLMHYDESSPGPQEKFSIARKSTRLEPIVASEGKGLISPEITGIRAELGRYHSPRTNAGSIWSALNRCINSEPDAPLPLLQLSGLETLAVTKSDREVAQVGLPGTEVGDYRSWIEVVLNGHSRLLSVPPEWRAVGRGGGTVPYSVHMKSREVTKPVARIYVHDPDMYDVMYAMTPTGIGEATMLELEARQWLYGKVNNPVAAAGGGFALLAHRLHRESREKWFGWLDNLDEFNPWLPDAAILRGTLRMKGPEHVRDFDAARDDLVRAYRSGIPCYTLGVTWLQSGLGKLVERDPELQEMFDQVSLLGRRIDTSAVFTSLRL